MLEIEVEIGRFGPAQVQEQRHTGEAESPATSLRQRRNVSGRLSRNVQDIAGKNFVGVGPFGLKGQVVRMVVDLAPVSETMRLGDRNYGCNQTRMLMTGFITRKRKDASEDPAAYFGCGTRF